MALNRREARAAVFELLFKTEFKLDEAKEAKAPKAKA